MNSIKAEPIAVENKYPGTRFHFVAHMDTIVQPMSIDIGFGDVVTPYPMSIDFPLLLQDIPSVNLHAYSIGTVIAEKFHTMLDRDIYNSRMKDFFDCYQLLSSYNIDNEELYDAIKATFDNRKLENIPDRQLFTKSFADDINRNIRWKSFLRKIQWKGELPFPNVMDVIRERLQPLERRYWEEKNK